MKDFLNALVDIVLLDKVGNKTGLVLVLVFLAVLLIVFLITIEDFYTKLFLFLGCVLYAFHAKSSYNKSKNE
jgi:hypothetical protein